MYINFDTVKFKIVFLIEMGRRRDLTNNQRSTMVTMRQAGVKLWRIAETLHISVRTVSRVLQQHQEHGHARKKVRPGRRPKTTGRDDRALRRLAHQQRFQSLMQLNRSWNNQTGIHTSTKTTGRRLHSMGIFSRYARRKPLKSRENRIRRVRWCTRVTIWNADDHWPKIVFSDESRFNLGYNDGRVRVWRTNGEAMAPENVAQVQRQGSSSVMVWGCISFHGVGQLVVVDGNLNSEGYIGILQEHLWQSVENMLGDRNMPFIFQHDNAPVHTARNVQAWLDEEDVQVMQWPAQSPDLNPIENVWSEMSRSVTRERPSNKNDLVACLFRCWGNISTQYLQTLYRSMPRRVRAVIRCRGYGTKY